MTTVFRPGVAQGDILILGADGSSFIFEGVRLVLKYEPANLRARRHDAPRARQTFAAVVGKFLLNLISFAACVEGVARALQPALTALARIDGMLSTAAKARCRASGSGTHVSSSMRLSTSAPGRRRHTPCVYFPKVT